jgi:hypothetical protein
MHDTRLALVTGAAGGIGLGVGAREPGLRRSPDARRTRSLCRSSLQPWDQAALTRGSSSQWVVYLGERMPRFIVQSGPPRMPAWPRPMEPRP